MAAAKKISQILHRYTDTAPGPGSLLGVSFIVVDKNGKTIHSSSAGKLNFKPDSPPFTTDSVTWIASLSKLVTCVAALQLVEKGLIGLDDDVGETVSELKGLDVLTGFDDTGKPVLVKQDRAITLRHLLTHTSGFAYDFFDPDLIRWSQATNRTITARAFTLEGWTLPLKFQPGTSWVYGVGFDWVGVLIETITSKTLSEYLTENIFNPLGMKSTTFLPTANHAIMARRAATTFRDKTTSPSDGPLTSEGPALPLPEVQPREGGGAGLYGTAGDYSRFVGALVKNDGSVLKPESVRQMFVPQLDEGCNATFMGLCSNPFRDMMVPEYPLGTKATFGLSGAINLEALPGKRAEGSLMWSGAANPHWWIDPKTGIAGVLMTEVMGPGDPVVKKLYDELEKAVYSELV